MLCIKTILLRETLVFWDNNMTYESTRVDSIGKHV